MKKAIKIVITGLIAGCIVAACYCAAYPFYEQRRAARFIGIVTQLKPGVTTELQAREALRSYRPESEQLVTTHWDIASNQTLRADGYDYLFANRGLFSIKRSEPVKLSAGLFFREGILVLKTVSFQKGSGECCLVLLKEADRIFDDSPQGAQGVSVEKKGDLTGAVIVYLKPNASEVDRRKAYSFNLGCLSSPSQCNSADSLLRGLW